MPTITETIQKVHGFAKLPEGWHYGEGEPVGLEIIKQAEKFLLTAEGWGIEEANAFPGIDGQVELTLYIEDKTFAFMFELDGTISIVEETRGEIVSDIYNQSYEIAEQKLWELSQRIQSIYDLFISDIGIRGTRNSEVRRFNAHQKKKTRNVEYRSFQPNVYWRQSGQSATTSRTFIVPLQATRLSSCA